MERKARKPELFRPGPGTFTLPVPKSGPVFSFSDKYDGIPLDHPKLLLRRKLVIREFHQPEYRDPPSYIGNSPGAKISPLRSNKKRDESPIGPCSYKPELIDYSPKYTMSGKRAKSTIDHSPGPGPGTYNAEKAIKYLFPSLTKTISVGIPETGEGLNRFGPGPGTYDPKKVAFVPGYK